MNSSAPYKKVYAIVVTYNALIWIRKCLGSLASSEHPVHVIVVDNGSTDGTRDIIEKEFSSALLIKSDTNLGFGRANNAGLKIALEKGADFCFLLNHDAWVDKNTIGNLVSAFEVDDSYGIISPLHFNGSGRALDKGFEAYTKKSSLNIEVVSDLTDKNIYRVEFINAAAWMVSRKCLETVGALGYIYPHYGEDRDYIQRIKYFGFNIGFVTNCKIYHDREGRVSELSTLKKIVWYYYTGLVARMADINKSYLNRYFAITFWYSKDLVYLLFAKRKWNALPAWFVISFKSLLAVPKILSYRSKIKKTLPFID